MNVGAPLMVKSSHSKVGKFDAKIETLLHQPLTKKMCKEYNELTPAYHEILGHKRRVAKHRFSS